MKKKLWKNLTKLMIAATVSVFMLTGCGGAEKKIVGTWIYDGDDSTIEFFDNGSARVKNYSSDPGVTYQWSLSEDTITLTPDDSLFNNTEIYTVEISDDVLTLTDNGTSIELNRMK